MNNLVSDALLNAEQEEDDLFLYTGKQSEKAVGILNSIFRKAVELKVADVHFQQTQKHGRVRFRMPGGALVNYTDIDVSTMKMIDEKIRSKSLITISDHQASHDGRFGLTIDGVNIDVRVAMSPGVSDGQLTVCRLLNQKAASMSLDDIRMSTATREAIVNLIAEPNGLFLITGPTGSGKTTTLYAMLNALNSESRNIITIENPVEYRNKDFHQIDVNNKSITFASALRAVVRQDPDVIMVGEIRDPETANIAVQAAITGHLVLSTTHANNAALGITRLVGFGVDPVLLGAALRGVTAQRLIPTLNPAAKFERVPPSDIEAAWLRANGINRVNPTFPKLEDESTAFKGFVPVMEVILADQRVKKVLHLGEGAIFAAASRQPQFETIAQASERLAYAGITTLTEARKLASIQEAINIKNKRLGQLLTEKGIVSDDDMESILTLQAKMRMEGYPKKLGQLLVENNMCDPETLFDAVGRTGEAEDILQEFCETDADRMQLASLVKKWSPGAESLFELAVNAQMVTIEELKDANTF